MSARYKRAARRSIAWHGKQSHASKAAGYEAVGRNMIVVRTSRQMRRLQADLVGTRRYPIVLVALAVDSDRPVFAPRQLQTVARSSLRIYVLPGLHPFHRPTVIAANSHLAVPRGCARICWPQLSAQSDPYDHPLVICREGESDRNVVARFAREFDLSRPRVRREIKLIESVRVTSEIELEHARARLSDVEQQLRDAGIARHQTGRRAEGAQQPSRPSGGR